MATGAYRRKLTAILHADVEGYSRLMGQDEESTVRTLTAYREAMTDLAGRNEGRIVDSPGDSILAEFASVVDAVKCAVAIQNELKTRNAALPEARRLRFRIGINLGDVIEEGERIYGDGVNVASRVQELAESGGICITRSAYDQVKNKLSFQYDYIGEHEVKNIEEHVRVYRVVSEIDTEGETSDAAAEEKRSGGRRRIAVATVVALLVGAVAATVWISREPEEDRRGQTEKQDARVAPIEKPSIAVLPFDNLSDDPKQEYFVDGMVDAIITKLSMNSMLTVIARNSTFYYKDKQVRIRQIGDELGARYVVEGSAWKANGKIRITAQLINAATEGHIWAETYDRELREVFTIQDEVAQRITAALAIASHSAEIERAKSVPTESLTAYDLFLRGCEHAAFHVKDRVEQAKALYEKAIGVDAAFALAHVGLADVYQKSAVHRWNFDAQPLVQSRKHIERALSIDDTVPGGYGALSTQYWYEGQHDLAISTMDRALTLNRNSAVGYGAMAWLLRAAGRYEESISAADKSIRLDPHQDDDYSAYYQIASDYYALGRYEEALPLYRDVLARNPNHLSVHRYLSYLYLDLWRIQQAEGDQLLDLALDMATTAVALEDSAGELALSLTYLYRRQYDQAVSAAKSAAKKLVSAGPKDPSGYAQLANVYNFLGRHKEAIELAEEAAQIHPLHNWPLIRAYYLTGRQEDAVTVAEQHLTPRVTFAFAVLRHIDLAILYSELGRKEEAKAEAAEVLKLVPDFSVEIYGERAAYKDPAQVERDMAALRKAGLK